MSTRAADAVQVRVQGNAVQSLHEHGLTWVSFAPMPDLACDIDFTLRKFPDLGLLSGTVQGVRHEHARRDSGDGNDDFSFHMNLSGLSFIAGRRSETTLRNGDAMLLSFRFEDHQPATLRGSSRHPAAPGIAQPVGAQCR
jgi:hypothetical protein